MGGCRTKNEIVSFRLLTSSEDSLIFGNHLTVQIYIYIYCRLGFSKKNTASEGCSPPRPRLPTLIHIELLAVKPQTGLLSISTFLIQYYPINLLLIHFIQDGHNWRIFCPYHVSNLKVNFKRSLSSSMDKLKLPSTGNIGQGNFCRYEAFYE